MQLDTGRISYYSTTEVKTLFSVLAACTISTCLLFGPDESPRNLYARPPLPPIELPVEEVSLRTSGYEPPFHIDAGSVYALDLRTEVSFTAEQLEKGLLYNLQGKGQLFLEYADAHDINVLFVMAVAALESGWGRSNWAESYNNYFGFAYGKQYSTFEDSLANFTDTIDHEYLNPEGKYHNGNTIYDVNKLYCLLPDNSQTDWDWGWQIGNLMVRMYTQIMEE